MQTTSKQSFEGKIDSNTKFHFKHMSEPYWKSYDYMANIILGHLESDIICTDIERNVIWTWNDNIKLWEDNGYSALVIHITEDAKKLIDSDMHLIQHIISKIKIGFNDIGSAGQDKFRGVIAHLETMLSQLVGLYLKLSKTIYLESVAELIKEISFDPSFADKLDNNKDLVPILNNNVMDFTTGECRTRIKEDYCTFICPV